MEFEPRSMALGVAERCSVSRRFSVGTGQRLGRVSLADLDAGIRTLSVPQDGRRLEAVEARLQLAGASDPPARTVYHVGRFPSAYVHGCRSVSPSTDGVIPACTSVIMVPRSSPEAGRVLIAEPFIVNPQNCGWMCNWWSEGSFPCSSDHDQLSVDVIAAVQSMWSKVRDGLCNRPYPSTDGQSCAAVQRRSAGVRTCGQRS